MNEMELQTTLDPIDMDMGDPVIEYSPVYPNPEGDPTDDLTKVQIQGNIYKIKDPEVHDWARAEEKPTYTKEEVGLGNVDNTSDMNKPVSTATQTALNNKVDKVAGKGLSEEDFTHTLKDKLDGIEAGAEVNTVNSVAGKTGNVTLNKSDVGLGNVDNTSDMNKPVSTATQEALQGLANATQTALNGKVDNSTLNNYYTKTETDTALGNKVDKVQGKGLSTNDYDDTAKGIVDGVTTALSGKVDKEEGYGLSQNDYSDEEKAKVGEIDNKLDKTETAVNSNGLVIATPVTDTAPYIYRQTPVKESFKALMHKIVGASVVWNQLVRIPTNSLSKTENGVTITDNRDGSYTISTDENGATAITTVDIYAQYKIGTNHIALVLSDNDNLSRSGLFMYDAWAGVYYTKRATIQKITTQSGKAGLRIAVAEGAVITTPQTIRPNTIDLTAMFGITIADYVNTLETSQSGSGIAWLQSYGFFTEDYYAYKQNTLESGCVSAHKTYDGETLLTNTELSPITLRGLFKLSTDKLTVDGDEYNADGSVERNIFDKTVTQNSTYKSKTTLTNVTRYAFVLSKTVDRNKAMRCIPEIPYLEAYSSDTVHFYCDNSGSGGEGRFYLFLPNDETTFEYTVLYNTNAPTTEQATPFTETEIVGTAEEFIDYEVTQSNRDVAIPVGTETDYYQEMKLPPLPTTSGNHNLIYNPSTGFGWT